MKLTRKELKRLIETFISGPFGTMDASDPYEKLHPDIKDRFNEKGSQQDPPVSGREYFLATYGNSPEGLVQINTLSDALSSDEQTYDTDEIDDANFDSRSPEDMAKEYDTFEDPMREYYSINTIKKYYKDKVPDLVVRSKKAHKAYTSGPGKTYTNSHTFYSADQSALNNIKSLLYKLGYRIVNADPPFSDQGGMFKVSMPSKKYNIPESFVGKFAFVALEPTNTKYL